MQTRNDQLRDKAQQFHNDHPAIWDLFCALTFDRIDKGFSHYSCRAIFHAIRWQTNKPVYERGEEFKINDHITPFYSRRFMRLFPKHDGFFRTRKQVSKNVPACGLEELKPSYFDGI